jgi:hypothetical protein
MTVYAVSPASVPGTNFARDMPWVMRNVMLPMMTALGPILGVAGPISVASQRYLDAAGHGKDRSGKFFASRPGKMVGNLVEQRTPLLQDAAKSDAAYRLIVELAGGTDVPRAPAGAG